MVKTPFPIRCRWLLRAAACAVPRRLRLRWREDRQREAEEYWALLLDRGWEPSRARRELWLLCREAAARVLAVRFDRAGLAARMPDRARSAGFLLVILAAALAAVAVGTRGFSGIRTVLSHPRYPYGGGVVFLSEPRSAMERMPGVRTGALPGLERLTSSFSAVAAYSLHHAWVDDQPVWEARVTARLFDLLGVRAALGRTFEPRDVEPAPRRILLSHDFWRERFHADPAVTGRRVILDERPAIILGVLPAGFGFLPARVKVWELMAGLRVPRAARMVARLAPGASIREARTETAAFARERGARGPAAIEITSMEDTSRQLVIGGAAAVPAFSTLLAVIAVALSGSTGRRRSAWRYWGLLWLKLALMLAVLAGIWMELALALPAARHGYQDAIASSALGWTMLLACVGAAWFCFRDHARRCPDCLARVVLPARIGSWSSPLLDPVSTEFVCAQGHGALYVAGSVTSASEAEYWRSLDSSWSELFARR
jgi:hypothetical protein